MSKLKDYNDMRSAPVNAEFKTVGTQLRKMSVCLQLLWWYYKNIPIQG